MAVCGYRQTMDIGVDHAKHCNDFKDKSKFVKLPCKVGDTFFILLKSQDILEYKVFSINIFSGKVYDYINIVLDRYHHRMGFTEGRFKYELGRSIFLTKEQAEQALRESESK